MRPFEPCAIDVRRGAVLAVAAALLVAAWSALPGAVVGSDENPYPEVNPCASGTSELSGTIKVCTLIREEGVVRVYTEPRRAMVWIQISETGPTAHVSDTVDGVAFVGENLTQRDDWHVSIQTWNLPSGVRLESQLVFLGVTVGEARTFTFACDAPPCIGSAPTSTPTITSGPSPTRSETLTPTAETTAIATATPTITPSATTEPITATATVTSTTVPTDAPTIGASPSPTPTFTAEPTWTEAPTAAPTATPAATDTPLPTPSVPPTPTATPTAMDAPTPAARRLALPILYGGRR